MSRMPRKQGIRWLGPATDTGEASPDYVRGVLVASNPQPRRQPSDVSGAPKAAHEEGRRGDPGHTRMQTACSSSRRSSESAH